MEQHIKNKEFESWLKKFESRNPNRDKMRQHNPTIIPRNHKVEEALEAANTNNLQPLHELLKAFESPYVENKEFSSYQNPALETKMPYQTFCGT